MQGTPGDKKHLELAKLIYGLRQNVDLYRVIGLNVEALQAKGVSNVFWAHIQRLAHEAIALTICKIYEAPNERYDLNSIFGVVNSLPEKFTERQTLACTRFAQKHNPLADPVTSRPNLVAVATAFRDRMTHELTALKIFRDKVGAHSEAGAEVEHLSSIDAYEKLFEFADQFYRLVARQFVDVEPSSIGTQVGLGAGRVMVGLGIATPQLDFPHTDRL